MALAAAGRSPGKNRTPTQAVDFVADERTTYNVLAETHSGNDANVVMAGAHLDSVQDGPGIKVDPAWLAAGERTV